MAATLSAAGFVGFKLKSSRCYFAKFRKIDCLFTFLACPN